MAKIRSTKELNYDARNLENKAIIELEVSDFSYSPQKREYNIRVKDSKVTGVDKDEKISGLNNLVKKYSKEDIDGLFRQLNNDITTDSSFDNKLNNMIGDVLLLITQQEPIYNSVSSDWVKVD